MSASGPVQQVRFCEAPDGVRIAYAVSGTGPPLLVSTCWLSHLQHDWESPVWRHFLDQVGRFATIIRYDERGYGLSDWDVTDHGLEARIGDLEAVADHAGLDRFALMGMAQGGPPAISYAARHPERVTRLLFYGSYAGAAAGSIESQEELEAFAQLIKVGWGRPAAHLPAGLHLDDDPGGHRGADALARRAPAGRRLRRRPPPTRCASGRRPTASTCCPGSTYRPWCCTRSATR